MVYVLVGSSPNFCGIVVNMHNVGLERILGRAFLQALRSLLMLISWLILFGFCRMIIRSSRWVIRRSMRMAETFTVCKSVYLRNTSFGLFFGRKMGSDGKIYYHLVYKVWIISATYGVLIVAVKAVVTWLVSIRYDSVECVIRLVSPCIGCSIVTVIFYSLDNSCIMYLLSTSVEGANIIVQWVMLVVNVVHDVVKESDIWVVDRNDCGTTLF